MRKLEPTSALCLFLFFCNEKRGLIVMGLHHQTNAFMKSSPSRLLQSSSGVIRRSQRRAENNVQRSDCSQDKEESAVDKFDFNVLPDREGTGSVKWELFKGKNTLPMWLADADIPTAPVITESLVSRIKSGAPFGYTMPTDGLKAAVAYHIASFSPRKFFPKKEFHNPPLFSQLFFLPGVKHGLVVSCGLNAPESAVMVITPIYPPFLSVAEQQGCKTVQVPLKMSCVPGAIEERRWTFDLDAMESAKMANPNMRMLLLCNPHNPVGRCFTVEELREVGKFCERHDMIIVSDDAHAGLILDKDVQHHCMAHVDGGEFALRTITIGAPSKTFNIAGLCSGWAYIPNSELMRKFRRKAKGIVGDGNSLLGYVAMEAAYTKGGPWKEAFLSHLRSNRDLVYEFISEKIPELRMEPMQATYLAWIDASRVRGWINPYLEFLNHGVVLSNGADFGDVGVNHVRLNFACPRTLLLDALHQMELAVKSTRS